MSDSPEILKGKFDESRLLKYLKVKSFKCGHVDDEIQAHNFVASE